MLDLKNLRILAAHANWMYGRAFEAGILEAIDRAIAAEEKLAVLEMILSGVPNVPSDAGISGKLDALQQHWYLTAKNDAAENQWLPIESAPKNGSPINLSNHAGVWVGYWNPVYASGFMPDNPWSSLMLNHMHMAWPYSLVPTHWRPLLTAPKLSEGI